MYILSREDTHVAPGCCVPRTSRVRLRFKVRVSDVRTAPCEGVPLVPAGRRTQGKRNQAAAHTCVRVVEQRVAAMNGRETMPLVPRVQNAQGP